MTKYTLTITQTQQGRKRDGQLPPESTWQLYQQVIAQHDIARIVSFLNPQPTKKVSSDGVVTEIVKPKGDD